MAEYSAPTTGSKAVRIALGLVGGYAFTGGYMAIGPVLLAHLGVNRGEALLIGVMTGFLVFVGVIVWAAATRHLIRTTAAVVICAALMIYLAPLIVPEVR